MESMSLVIPPAKVFLCDKYTDEVLWEMMDFQRENNKTIDGNKSGEHGSVVVSTSGSQFWGLGFESRLSPAFSKNVQATQNSPNIQNDSLMWELSVVFQ